MWLLFLYLFKRKQKSCFWHLTTSVARQTSPLMSERLIDWREERTAYITYCCGSLYSIITGETIRAVEEGDLYLAVAAASCLDDVQVCKYIRSCWTQQTVCSRNEHSVVSWPNYCLSICLDFSHFLNNSKRFWAEQASGRRARCHQRDDVFHVFAQFYPTVEMCLI